MNRAFMLRALQFATVLILGYESVSAQVICGRMDGTPTDMQVHLSFEDQQASPETVPDGGLATAGKDATGTNPTSGKQTQAFDQSMQIRVELQDGFGGRLLESSPNAEGKLAFRVCSRSTYRVRVTGPDIEEANAQSLEPGRGDKLVDISLRHKGEKPKSISTGVVSASRLKVPRKAQKDLDRGNAALAANNLAEARTAFEKAISDYPAFDQAYNNLGVVLMQTGDPSKGKAAFQKAVQINGHYARALSNLAKIALDEKDYAKALDFVKRSLAIEPLNPRTLLLGTQAAYFAGAYEESIGYADSLHLLPHAGMGLAHYLCAKSLEKVGQPQKAIAEYQRFLLEEPSDPNVPSAQMAIVELKALSQAKQ